MPDYRYPIYDTWQPSTTANAQQTLFQVSQGGDSTHTPQFTNMRGAGSFPQSEKLVLQKIRIFPDKLIPLTDVTKWLYGGILELVLSNVSILFVPLELCVGNAAWSGSLTEATAVDDTTVGLLGDGFDVTPNVTIGGQMPFKVNLTQGLALSAGTNIKVVLDGVYTIS